VILLNILQVHIAAGLLTVQSICY